MSSKLFFYVLICGYLFAFLDWKVVHYTRIANRNYLDWMHAHERVYATVTRSAEWIICTPAMMLKPAFYLAMMHSEASQEEQDVITHSPRPTWRGFYNLPVRGDSWTFVSWSAWALYWLVPSLVWVFVVRRFF